MRPLRAIGLTVVGFVAGFTAATAAARRALPSRGDADSDDVALVAVLNGIELESRAAAFRGGSMLAWLGGIAVDLRGATLAPDANLSLTTLLGGIAIRVPHGWRVESSMTALGGGVAIDVPEPDDADAPRLVLEGTAFLGGIAIQARALDETGD